MGAAIVAPGDTAPVLHAPNMSSTGDVTLIEVW